MTLPLARTVLLNNASATGNAVDWGGGRGDFTAYGTFGGATVALQFSPDDGTTWINVDPSGSTYVTFTTAGVGGFELPKGQIRAAITGGIGVSVSATVGGAR